MSGPSHAYVLHRTPNRLRMKVPDRRGDRAFFRSLQRTLSLHPDVFRVEVNPRSASVIVRCQGNFDLASINNPFLGLSLVAEAPRRAVASSRPVRPSGNTERGGLDLNSLVVKLALATLRGQLKAQLLEWCLEWAVGALVRVLITQLRPAHRLRPGAPPALLAAA